VLKGKYKRATFKYMAPGQYGPNATLYVQLNDPLENTLAVYTTKKPDQVAIADYLSLESDYFKSTTKWTMRAQYKGLDDLVVFFDKCYERVANDAKQFDDLLVRGLDKYMSQKKIKETMRMMGGRPYKY
jgi:hypothetical protein